MPSLMIHLQTARLVRPDGGGAFFVGTAAPDALDDFRQKDHTHLRSAPDRAAALRTLAQITDPSDTFAEGVLLHLFADWRWDETQLRRYWDSLGVLPPDGAWVPGYRREISLASTHIFHTAAWSSAVWTQMIALPRAAYGSLELISPEDVEYFLYSNFRHLSKADGVPSVFYPPALVDAFAQETAEEYKCWRG
jgi:hypothetical protein